MCLNKAKRKYCIHYKPLSDKDNIVIIHRGNCNSKARLQTRQATRKLQLGGYYLMVVPCKRSIFLLSSAMMLCSSVMRSSYRSVVRSWTSSCSLIRWDCSHWIQESKTEMPMSCCTYRLVILKVMASSYQNLNTEHTPNKTYAC